MSHSFGELDVFSLGSFDLQKLGRFNAHIVEEVMDIVVLEKIPWRPCFPDFRLETE